LQALQMTLDPVSGFVDTERPERQAAQKVRQLVLAGLLDPKKHERLWSHARRRLAAQIDLLAIQPRRPQTPDDSRMDYRTVWAPGFDIDLGVMPITDALGLNIDQPCPPGIRSIFGDAQLADILAEPRAVPARAASQMTDGWRAARRAHVVNRGKESIDTG
jgi:hypothetical protein